MNFKRARGQISRLSIHSEVRSNFYINTCDKISLRVEQCDSDGSAFRRQSNISEVSRGTRSVPDSSGGNHLGLGRPANVI